MKRRNNVVFLAESAVIAALYAVLTYIAAMMNLAYGAVQFRFSEALTVLPLFTPAAIPGLTVGCFISNLGSALGIVDWIFGTIATFLGAVLTRMLREIKIGNIPLLAVLMPVFSNTFIIGFEISCLSEGGTFSLFNFTWPAFIGAAVSVGIGELAVCFLLGIPLILYLNKSKLFERIGKSNI